MLHRFEALNSPKPWDLPAQAGRLLGKLDLKSGVAVVAVAEVLNAAVGDSISKLAGLPYPGGVLAFVLPALAGFFHRKDKKSKGGEGAIGNFSGASSPQEMAASVSESRKSTLLKLWDRVRSSLDLGA